MLGNRAVEGRVKIKTKAKTKARKKATPEPLAATKPSTVQMVVQHASNMSFETCPACGAKGIPYGMKLVCPACHICIETGSGM